MNGNGEVAGAAAASNLPPVNAGLNRPLVVYTIVEQDEKSFWRRVGSGRLNRDGSFNIYLDALPVNGRLHVREVEGALNSERSNNRGLFDRNKEE